MAQSWPVSLQDRLNAADFSETAGDTTIRSDMEIGLAKVRNRYSDGVDTITCSINIEKDEVVTFKNFYKTTLNGGVTSFEYKDPYTDVLTEFRFVTSSPYQISPVGGNTMRLSMTWERIP